MRGGATVVLLLVAGMSVAETRQNASELREALIAAVKPALPFPEATMDGTASGGDPAAVWTVRWPDGDDAVVEVLANPLNPENHARALKVEEAIQKSAMQSQQRSQADYEKALSDFQRTGRTEEIREISLRDDGLAGERYDAESQLIIEARAVALPHRVTLGTTRLPEAFPAADGPTAIVRVAANEYKDSGTATEPGGSRFCAEQAWLFFGTASRPVVSRSGPNQAAILVEPAPADATAVVVSIRGNVELVDRVLQRANWSIVQTRAGQ